MTHAHRIVSLLPAATEMLCALEMGSALVGVSAECDYPPEITHLPRLVRPAIDLQGLAPVQIDAAVRARLHDQQSLYLIDEVRLRALAPTLIIAQDLCQVCAPSGHELSAVLALLPSQPEVVFLSPRSLADITRGLHDLATVVGRRKQAQMWMAAWERRRQAVERAVASRPRRPRVLTMEWTDPIYSAGHWFAEMIEIAGGQDLFARPRQDSVRIEWEQARQWQPEIIIVAPCGYSRDRAAGTLPSLARLPGWNTLPAVQRGRVYPVDANAYFTRPGPRVFDGLEILADLFAVV